MHVMIENYIDGYGLLLLIPHCGNPLVTAAHGSGRKSPFELCLKIKPKIRKKKAKTAKNDDSSQIKE